MFASEKRWSLAGVLLVIGILTVSCSAAGTAGHAAPTSKTAASPIVRRQPLTGAQLRALAFKESEVPQARSVYMSIDNDPHALPVGATFPPVSDAACQKTIDITGHEGASVVVSQQFQWNQSAGQPFIFPSFIELASYADAKPEQSFQQLRAALRTCTSFSAESWGGKYTVKITLEKDLRFGDETLRFCVANFDADGKLTKRQCLTFVRVGSATALFRTDHPKSQPCEFPIDIVKRQVRRLSDAQRP